MQVLEDQDQRLGVGPLLEELRGRLEEPKARLLAAGPTRGFEVREARAKLGHDLG